MLQLEQFSFSSNYRCARVVSVYNITTSLRLPPLITFEQHLNRSRQCSNDNEATFFFACLFASRSQITEKRRHMLTSPDLVNESSSCIENRLESIQLLRRKFVEHRRTAVVQWRQC